MTMFLPFLVVIFRSFGATKIPTQDVPLCVNNKIEFFKKEPRQNPPRSIIQYTYKGNRVYYLPAPCCDQFSEIVDSNCNLLGHPDGGLAGKGDGKLPDFKEEAKDES